MFEHHPRCRGIRRGRDRTRRFMVAIVCVALAGAVVGACAPEPPPALAVCPDRTEVPLEPPDPVSYSLPRAVSPDGEWLVASRVVGADLNLSVRRTQSDGSSTPVGSLPYVQAATGTLLVSVPADGGQVVFGTAGTAATEQDPQTTLRRWRASTGTVSDLPVPMVASPPPGVAYPMNAFGVSADGMRVLWTQSFREGPEPYVWHELLVVTDATTDAVVSTASIDDVGLGPITGDGAAMLNGHSIIATGSGSVTDLTGEVAAAQAVFPGPQLQVAGISDDLRQLALRRYDSTVVPGVLTYVVWDRPTGTGRVALQVSTTGQANQPQVLFDLVTPGGSLLATEWSSPPNLADVLESHPAAGVRTIASSATVLTPQFSWHVSTTDGRTVVLSRQSLLGQQLVAQRCS